MFVTGILLFMSEAIKCYYSFAFWIKMASLLLALVFAFTIRRHVVQAGPTSGSWRQGRLTALASLVLWFGVAWGGRWIGFS
jgi:hypothetical protein